MVDGELLLLDDNGLHCPRGGFYIDPWRPVKTAILSHAHADHARPGSAVYHCALPATSLVRARLGAEVSITAHPYRECFRIKDVEVTFFPAGHVLGSAQIRLRAAGSPTVVVTGDFKREDDPTCESFEPVACDTLVTEATFALPVYRFQPTAFVVQEILAWWRENRDRASIVFCYALGKSQRLLAELARRWGSARPGPIYCHGAVAAVNRVYAEAGVELPEWVELGDRRGEDLAGALIVAPPSAHRSPWMKRAHRPATAFCSGWMAVRGARRRRGYERGFVLSDHADWHGILRTVIESGAGRVLVTHGQNEVLARYLRDERGLDAQALATLYAGEDAGDQA